MTSSSTSEPELETQPAKTETPPAKTDPPETIDLTSTEESPANDADTDVPVADDSAGPAAVPAPIGVDVAALSGALEEIEVEAEPDGAIAGEPDEVLGSRPSDTYSTLFPLIGAVLGLTAVTALILIAFALPAVKSTPHRLPIGVSGSAEVNSQLRQVFAANGSTTFTVRSFSKESDLRAAIQDRTIYGGLSVTEAGVSMLVSTGGSAVVADTLNSVANSLSSQVGSQIPVTDVAGMPASDPRGEGLAAANLALVLAAVLPALILIPLYRRRTGAQLAVTVGAAVAIGLGLSAVLSFALGSTEDSNFLLVSASLAAGVLATSLLLLGLFAVAGRIGLGVGTALLVLFAAPLSGLSTAPEWLPQPWGAIGQLLPAGANASLLRSSAYFDGSGAGKTVLVLGAWALLGLLLIGLQALIKRRPAGAGDVVPD